MNNDEEDIRCQVMWQLNQDKKYDEVVEHVLTGCLNCITNPKKRFNGREMLFSGGPPPWIKVPESEKKNPEAWKKYQKKRVHVQMTPEEFEQYLVNSELSDNMMCFEIAKFRRCEKVQAWAGVREIRKLQKANWLEKEKKEKEIKKKEMEAKREAEKLKKADEKRKINDQKQQIEEEEQEYLNEIEEEEKLLNDDPDEKDSEKTPIHHINEKKEYNLVPEMPWKPTYIDLLCKDQTSQADHQQQKRIIAMCQNLLYQGALRHSGNKHELRDLRKDCESEYDILVAAALEKARNETIHPLDWTQKDTEKPCLSSFLRREPGKAEYLFKSPIFTVENIEMVSGLRSESQAIIPKMERLLKKAGWKDQLTIPDITKKCPVLKREGFLPTKTKLQNDQLAYSLIATCPQVSVMMDATTVCHLLAPNWEARDYEFGIPIVVTTERIDGADKKVVVLSKPMPSNTITKASIQRKTLKRWLKKRYITRKTPKPTRNPSEPSTSSEKPLEAAQEDELSDTESIKSVDSEVPTTSSDFLDDIISNMEKPKNKIRKEKTRDSTYQYAIFRIGDARLLVRSNSPYQFIQLGEKKYTLLQNAKGITFEPRIEYMPSGGAMDLGPAEWIWNYTKAILKMSDSHILYRTSYKLDNILQVDALTMRPDLQQPPPDALGLLSSRCMMLEQMIAQLEGLEDGEYLAFQSKNVLLVVVPKCSEEGKGGCSIDSMRIKEHDIQMISDTKSDDFFYGFSPDVPFQWQIVQGRAPRMLRAVDAPKPQPPKKKLMNEIRHRKESLKRRYAEKKVEMEEAKRQKEIDWDDPKYYADFTNPSVSPMHFAKKQFDKKRKRGGFRGGRGGFGRGRGRGGGERAGTSQEHQPANIP